MGDFFRRLSIWASAVRLSCENASEKGDWLRAQTSFELLQETVRRGACPEKSVEQEGAEEMENSE